jgi:mono/diheme cytochrome c family protein
VNNHHVEKGRLCEEPFLFSGEEMKVNELRCILLALLVMSLVACQDSVPYQLPNITVPLQLLNDPASPRVGARLFEKHCLECHGSLAEGRNPRATNFRPPAPDFFNPIYAEHEPSYLFWRISKGKGVEPFLSRGSVMPVFGPHLSDQQIWQLVAYLRQRATHRLNNSN